MMECKVIFTIARQFGSGGRDVGKKLAESLGIPFYDKSLIQIAAKESGIEESLFHSVDEEPSNSFWDALTINANIFGSLTSTYSSMPINDKLFIIQSNVIKNVAAKESCVIVGRCADYILRDEPGLIRVFVHGKEEDKLHRIIHQYGVPEADAKGLMVKTDKKRSSYYNYYADGKWGRAENYDLALNTSALGIDGAVELIKRYREIKCNK